MPRKETHALASLTIPLVVLFVSQVAYKYPIQYGIASFLCVIGGLTPDIIEKSTVHSYTHRRFWHSKRMLCVFGALFVVIFLVWFFLFKNYYLLYSE
jgi:hypothetical protein